MVNFYCWLIQNSAIQQMLLNNLFNNSKKNNSTYIQWTGNAEKAFENYKLPIANVALFFHPNPVANTAVTLAASDEVIGGVLEQRIRGKIKPLAIFFNCFIMAECKCPYNQELLAVYGAVKHFKYAIECRMICIYNDHKLPTFAFQ
ncbi:uncharacterized protein TNIN_141171 [Trichonephila inaurata madagascariensis]|uniref:Reverse transcriptase/retrotransposon-derived protein RNase H-like domain-containing protein n=1 Tax=Trichonephila inaurata madagascariensis TaxID=2747483 RepID=A0A8X6XFH4_9ARAC|nr:uncharacterized protein TNIN_141171 [Trichonephila inaurata madagascariensis]